MDDDEGAVLEAEIRRVSASPRPGRRRWLRWAAAAVAGGLLIIALRTESSLLRGSIRALAHLRWYWVLAAIVAEVASMGTFARMQRRILRSGGLRLAITSVIAITYAGNAIAVSLPLAGAGIGTSYSYRQFSGHGASRAIAAWALTIAGIISSTAFAVIICAGAIVSGNPWAIVAGALGTAATIVPLVAILVALRHRRSRDQLIRFVVWILVLSKRIIRHPTGDPSILVTEGLLKVSALRLVRRDAVVASVFALLNWLLDIACLAFGLKAVGLTIPWQGLILAWSAGAVAATLNLTPGGLGIVEATTAAALVGLGVRSTPAMASVLVYRIISFWLVLCIGWSAYWVMQRRSASFE